MNNIKIVTLFILFFSFLLSGYCQKYNIDITIKNAENKTAYLLTFYGDENNLIDSVKLDSTGKFSYIFTNRYSGMYRLYIDKDNAIDFVFNNENIKLVCEFGNTDATMQIISSKENKIFYDFLQQEEASQRKLELLIPLISYYPKDDKFYDEAAKTYNKLQHDRDNRLVKIIKDNAESYVAKIIQAKRTPIVDAAMGDKEKIQFLKNHFWDNIDFKDTSLFRSNILTSKSISFLVLFNAKKLPPPLQEEAFIEAVDILLPKAKTNEKAYEFILNFLMNGFENFKLDKVLAHISTNYKVEKCENETRKTTLQKRMDSYQNLTIGKKAISFNVPDLNTNEVTLESSKSELTLLIFWASWCPHCTQMLPEIKTIYDSQTEKKFEVIAFSLDTAKNTYSDFLTKGKYTWLNCSDLKGWNSKVADDYCIYATPTMFLLDKKKYIIGKPLTTKDLLVLLNQYNVFGSKK